MTRRPRVLMIVGQLNELSGGGERMAVGLATELPQHGFDVWVCTTSRRPVRGSLLEALADAGVQRFDLARSRRFDVAAALRLRRFIRSAGIDVVHSHMFGPNVWGAVLGRASRAPVVIAHEQTWSYEGVLARRATDWGIGRLVDAFVAVSSADAERMARLEHVPRRKLRVVPNAWWPRTVEAAGDVRAELGIGASDPVIGTVAILRAQKRLDVLLDAFALVLRDAPSAWLLIAGHGEERAALEQHAAGVGVDGRVLFLGPRDDVDAVWRAVDVAAMSSDFEGTPLAALEAIGQGVPLVATDVGGLPDIGGPAGEHGVVLTAPGDPGALAAELSALLVDPERRQELGRAAAERAQEFTVARYGERFAALYRELLATI